MGQYNARIEECKPGMTLSKDVHTDRGAILMTAGTVLTDFIIDKIVINNINRVWVFGEEPQQILKINSNDSPEVKKTKKEYIEKIENIKTLFQNILTDDSVEEKAKGISSSIIKSERAIGDLLRCIRSLKTLSDKTYTHSLNVASICNLIASWMKLDRKQIEEITLAGLLHDVGKLQIPPEIFNKTTELTESETIEIKRHAEYGYKILKEKTSLSDEICNGVLMHHEKEDGSGYPNGVKGKDINLFAKIISVADLYSIITLDRVYKRADTPFSIFEIFESSASQKFDTLTVYTLLSNIAMYYIGDNVKLSNGKSGQIFYIDNEFVSRPLIKLSDNSILDLRAEKGVKIVEII
ncbi:MAG: HD-GYP domain-containing protein [Bacillota bacterium]|nr:HD-GYP domain-containing protein [Bacillota bacterium]